MLQWLAQVKIVATFRTRVIFSRRLPIKDHQKFASNQMRLKEPDGSLYSMLGEYSMTG